MAVLDASGELIGASEEVWRYLGWNVLIDGRMTRLPVETLGPLPPFPQAAIRARRIVETA